MDRTKVVKLIGVLCYLTRLDYFMIVGLTRQNLSDQ